MLTRVARLFIKRPSTFYKINLPSNTSLLHSNRVLQKPPKLFGEPHAAVSPALGAAPCAPFSLSLSLSLPAAAAPRAPRCSPCAPPCSPPSLGARGCAQLLGYVWQTSRRRVEVFMDIAAWGATRISGADIEWSSPASAAHTLVATTPIGRQSGSLYSMRSNISHSSRSHRHLLL
jgi:hypothetical protein